MAVKRSEELRQSPKARAILFTAYGISTAKMN
jgi:hypothetical protein